MNIRFKIFAIGYFLISSSSIYSQVTDKTYYQGSYPSDHWALIQPLELNHPRVIAIASYKDKQYSVFINSTDKRGYRSIVLFTKIGDRSSTFNRDYSTTERIGLGLVLQLISDAYGRIMPISQTAVAGNVSQQFDSQTGITCIGTEKEPSLLHGHVFGRGNPEACYIDDVKLDGPIPGLNFDMMARTSYEPGNDAKIKWKEGEVEKVAARLKIEVEKIKEEYEEQGLIVITQ